MCLLLLLHLGLAMLLQIRLVPRLLLLLMLLRTPPCCWLVLQTLMLAAGCRCRGCTLRLKGCTLTDKFTSKS
jgi:hypothetical protein